MPNLSRRTLITRVASIAPAALAVPMIATAGAPHPPYVMSARTRHLLDLIEHQQRDVDAEIALDEGTPEHDAAVARSEASWSELEPIAEAVIDAPTRNFDDAVAKALVARHLNAGKRWRGFAVGWEGGPRASAAAALAILNLAGLDHNEAVA